MAAESPRLRFPDGDTMRGIFLQNAGLNIDYFQQRGLTQAVAEIAAKEFANTSRALLGLDGAIECLIEDLKEAVTDGSTRPVCLKFDFSFNTWIQIQMSVKQALQECANAASKKPAATDNKDNS